MTDQHSEIFDKSKHVDDVREIVLARAHSQAKYYSSASKKAKKFHYTARASEIVLAASIAAFSSSAPAIVASLGAGVVAIAALQQVFGWQQHWILYRSCLQQIKRETHLFLAGFGRYKSGNSTELFGLKIEEISAQEEGAWFDLQTVEQKPHSSSD